MRQFVLLVAVLMTVAGQSATRLQPWPSYAADNAATHYSPLTDITPANVSQLAVRVGVVAR